MNKRQKKKRQKKIEARKLIFNRMLRIIEAEVIVDTLESLSYSSIGFKILKTKEIREKQIWEMLND